MKDVNFTVLSVVKKSNSVDHLCSSSTTLSDPRGPLCDKVPAVAIASANAAITKFLVTKAKGAILVTLVIIHVARMPSHTRPTLP